MTKKLLVVFMIENYKRVYYKMSTYYPPYKCSSSNVKVELDIIYIVIYTYIIYIILYHNI